jgi:hypothetical protein
VHENNVILLYILGVIIVTAEEILTTILITNDVTGDIAVKTLVLVITTMNERKNAKIVAIIILIWRELNTLPSRDKTLL